MKAMRVCGREARVAFEALKVTPRHETSCRSLFADMEINANMERQFINFRVIEVTTGMLEPNPHPRVIV